MGEYSKFISEVRRAVPTPKSMVRDDGICEFGTFDKEFREMDLVKLKKPTSLPDCFNRFKLSLWEAVEVNMKDGILLSAVCDMGLFGKVLSIYYDKATHKLYRWEGMLKSKETFVAGNLLGGSITEGVIKKGYVKFVNTFEDGICDVEGKQEGKEGTLEYSFRLTRISKPCVVSIPFGKNRPLYSQKDFFKAEGRLVINGEEKLSDENTVAIVDDHKGYYPRKAHYDWVTTMGKNVVNGEEKYFAFNLTHNQSIDQDKYNENLIWLENETSFLPPITFTRSPESKDFKDYSEWKIKDEYGMVDVTFKVYGQYSMILHALVANIDYYITFGELEGYVLDEDGNKYVLDGMAAIGEDKSLLF